MNSFINKCLTAATVSLLTACSGNDIATVTSPDGNIKVTVTDNNGRINYSVAKNGDDVLLPSALGFVLENGDSLARFEIDGVSQSAVDETWETVWGECRNVRNNYREAIVSMTERDSRRRVNLVMRVFDDGIGYRYEFPGNGDSLVIMSELTEFSMPPAGNAWWISSHNPYYEDLFSQSPVSELDTVRTPLTIETADGRYLAIHEAALVDYPKMNLARTDSATLTAQLVPWSNGVAAYVTTPFATPWRTVIIGEKPGDLITSRLMLNLNEPCRIDDTSWIRPMKYIGIWWEMHLGKGSWYAGPKHSANTAHVKEYIDFAAENGIPGVLVEGWNTGWEGHWPANEHFDFTSAYPDFDIKEITRYADEKGVELIGHHETAAWVTNYENQLDRAFDFYTGYGVNNVKTGYVNPLMDGREAHDSQYGVRHYRKVVETAARHGINIDNHEPVMPTGWQRTYPNLMTQEGVRGQEHNAWNTDGGNPPEHTVIVPFTRGLAGPMDFTFGTFNFNNEKFPGTRVQTTLAKQLALFVVIYSPMQMASDLPENYRGQKAFDFIKDVPVDWDETIVVDSRIGDYIVTARKDRNSADWYLGAITDEDARNLNVPLTFLDSNAEYVAQIYADGPDAGWKDNPADYTYSEQTVHSTDTIPLNLATSGGTAIRFTKK